VSGQYFSGHHKQSYCAEQQHLQITWSNVAAGTYSVTAKATDNLGASTTSTPITVVVASGTAKIYDIQTDQINTPRVITD
ncbi:hypothetical protein, partial [Sphingomonas sp. 10B4]|uniref:hypothetical protein n=1 Tax=Sphingomonas sp. 10B4 TaxID=3048575 RepID=UPI002B23DBCF